MSISTIGVFSGITPDCHAESPRSILTRNKDLLKILTRNKDWQVSRFFFRYQQDDVLLLTTGEADDDAKHQYLCETSSLKLSCSNITQHIKIINISRGEETVVYPTT